MRLCGVYVVVCVCYMCVHGMYIGVCYMSIWCMICIMCHMCVVMWYI